MHTEQAYQDGYDAFQGGEPLSSNPISAWQGELFDAWNIGWLDAQSRCYVPGPSDAYERKCN